MKTLPTSEAFAVNGGWFGGLAAYYMWRYCQAHPVECLPEPELKPFPE